MRDHEKADPLGEHCYNMACYIHTELAPVRC